MCCSDVVSDFGREKYGLYITVGMLNHLVTWNDVVKGRQSGICIWKQCDNYRDVYTIFKSRRKTKNGLTLLLNMLYQEFYGDHIPLFHLLTC
jgi:hypothetical protein